MKFPYEQAYETRDAEHNARLPLAALGAAVSIALLLTGLIFRTYWIAVSPPSLEGLRQLGIIFLLVEAVVILLAFSRGFSVADIFDRLDRPEKIAAIIWVVFILPGGLLYSPIAATATSLSLVMLLHIVFGAAIWFALAEIDRDAVDRFSFAVFAGLLAFVPLLAWTFVFPPPEIDPYQHQWQFALPGFISVRTFGAYTGAITAFFLGLALIDRERKAIPIWILAAITLSAGLTLWSGTRAAVVGVGCALLLIGLLTRWRWHGSSMIRLACCLAIAIAAATSLQPYGDPAFQLFASGDAGSADVVTGGRLSYWSDVIDAIAEYPLLGAGSAASSWALPSTSQQHVQPHNVVLQFLLSWGIFGTAAALFLIARATHKAYIIARSAPLAIPFMAMVCCLLVNALFDGTFYFARHVMLMMIGFGVIFAIGRLPGSWKG